jgi:hypothetical protein
MILGHVMFCHQMIKLTDIFKMMFVIFWLWNADIPKICIENPVMHKYAKERIENFEKQAQSFQPYEFGHDENSWDNQKKRICLWLKNLPLLEKTGTLDGSTARSDVHNAPPSEDRWKFRSKFFPGIAQAMADQWT